MTTGVASDSSQSTLKVDYFILINSMGEGMLIETMKMAAYYLKHSSRTLFKDRHQKAFYREGSSCYAFMQGSALEIAINRLGLDYDAEKLRDGFNYCSRRWF